MVYAWHALHGYEIPLPQTLHMSRCKAYNSKEKKNKGRKVLSNSARSVQITCSMVYPRSRLHYMACKCGFGQKIKWQVEDVHQLHELKLSLSKGCMPSTQSKSMMNLLKKTKHFDWSEECEHAFQQIKATLATTPHPSILTKLKTSKRLIVYHFRYL